MNRAPNTSSGGEKADDGKGMPHLGNPKTRGGLFARVMISMRACPATIRHFTKQPDGTGIPGTT